MTPFNCLRLMVKTTFWASTTLPPTMSMPLSVEPPMKVPL